jgi:hypothetical protein
MAYMGNNYDHELIVYCKHCNVQARVQSQANYLQRTVKEGDEQRLFSDMHEFCRFEVKVFKIAECPKCLSVFFIEDRFSEGPGEYFEYQDTRVLYPIVSAINEEGIPDNVISSYKEAVQCYSAGLYDSCVIMCGKCLHAICNEFGVSSKKPLNTQLGELHKSGHIDQRIFQWAEQLRLIRNEGAHSPGPIDRLDALDSIEFLELVMNYLFTLTRRFDALKNRRSGE